MKKILIDFIGKVKIRNHIFKLAGVISGLILQEPLGAAFGLIGGILIDQLAAEHREKKQIRTFFSDPPANLTNEEQIHIAASAIIWRRCSRDSAKKELLYTALPELFPKLPRQSR